MSQNLKSSIINLKSPGFTLMEVVMVMAMLAILGGLAMITGFDSYRAYVFRGERDTVVMALQAARSQAINNVCLGSSCTDGKPHGVEIQSGQYVIFQGATYATRDSAFDQAFSASSLVSHSPSAPMEIDFTQLSGATTAQSITLSDGTRTDTITVNSEGRIDW